MLQNAIALLAKDPAAMDILKLAGNNPKQFDPKTG